MKIYQTFFKGIYDNTTISRNRLALTDDDNTKYDPFENAIVTDKHYKYSQHMLCIFHALVKPFHEQVYPKLPASGNVGKRKLTAKG